MGDARGALALGVLTGVPMGLLTVYGVPAGWEGLLWIVVAGGAWLPAIVRRRMARPVLSGLLAGLVAGLAAGLLQALRMAEYLGRNPAMAEQVEGLEPMQARLGIVLPTVVIALLLGILAGAVAALLRRSMERTLEPRLAGGPGQGHRRAASPEDTPADGGPEAGGGPPADARRADGAHQGEDAESGR